MRRALRIAAAWAAARSIERLVCKAIRLPEVAQIARLESKASDLLQTQWGTASEVAAQAAASALESGRGASGAIDAARRVMAGWADAVAPAYLSALEDAFYLAREAGWKKATTRQGSLSYDVIEKAAPRIAPPTISVGDVVDKAAVSALQQKEKFWIGKLWKSGWTAEIRRIAQAAIEEGRVRGRGEELGQLLGRSFQTVQTAAGLIPTKDYLEANVANAVTTARAQGQLRSFVDLGVVRYEIVNPSDDRTCPVCSFLNGKVFEVSDGASQMSRVLAAKDPDGVKAVHPWLGEAELKALSSGPGNTGAKETGLVGRGQALPPYHYKCRCAIDISGSIGSWTPPSEFVTPPPKPPAAPPKAPPALPPARPPRKPAPPKVVPPGKPPAVPKAPKTPTQPPSLPPVKPQAPPKAPPTAPAVPIPAKPAIVVPTPTGPVVATPKAPMPGLPAVGWDIADSTAPAVKLDETELLDALYKMKKKPGSRETQRAIRRHLNSIGREFGIQPSDLVLAKRARGSFEVANLGIGTAGCHWSDSGKIGVVDSSLNEAIKFLETRAAGKKPPDSISRGLQTFVHEQMHGSTMTKGLRGMFDGSDALKTYKTLEEIGAEMAARRIMIDRFGVSRLFIHSSQGSYQLEIDMFRLKILIPALKKALPKTGLGGVGFDQIIEDAGLAFRQRTDQLRTIDQYTKAFADSFSLPAKITSGMTADEKEKATKAFKKALTDKCKSEAPKIWKR